MFKWQNNKLFPENRFVKPFHPIGKTSLLTASMVLLIKMVHLLFFIVNKFLVLSNNRFSVILIFMKTFTAKNNSNNNKMRLNCPNEEFSQR